jgi:predicted amidohydrolase
VVYNSAILIGERGDTLLNYRKTHLWMDVEKSIYAVGDGGGPGVVRLDPHDVRVGIAICYDCEFSEPCRVLALEGAQLILIPTALAKGEVHETVPLTVVPTRAVDNHVSRRATHAIAATLW